MRTIAKIMTGAAAAALVTLSAAAPAQAQYYGRGYYHDRDDIDLGDIAAGIAIVGGVALAIDALDGDDRYYDGRYYDRGYGYNNGYRRGGARAAVNACGYEARRYGSRVTITDVDRRDYATFRVRGRIDVRDYDYGRWGPRYDIDRDGFTCYAQGGRVVDFRV